MTYFSQAFLVFVLLWIITLVLEMNMLIYQCDKCIKLQVILVRMSVIFMILAFVSLITRLFM